MKTDRVKLAAFDDARMGIARTAMPILCELYTDAMRDHETYGYLEDDIFALVDYASSMIAPSSLTYEHLVSNTKIALKRLDRLRKDCTAGHRSHNRVINMLNVVGRHMKLCLYAAINLDAED